MAEFVLSEAEVEDSVCNDMSIVSEERESDREFIDDVEYDENVKNYRGFHNVSRDYDDAINDLHLILVFLKKQLIIVLIIRLKKW